MSFIVQKNGTPMRNPRKSGGSPSGVNEPPIFATRKMKKTMTWALCFRHLLALRIVRIRIMAAPVVPIHEATAVPMARRSVFNRGVPFSEPLRWIPPATVNNAQRRMMNGMYSSKYVWRSASTPRQWYAARKGAARMTPQNAVTLG